MFVLSRFSPLPKFRLSASAFTRTFRNVPIGLAIAFEPMGPRPMLKIQRTGDRRVVFTIIGQLDAGNLNELCQLVEAEPAADILILDLTDLILADRDAVRALRQYEARGRVFLRNCPAYVRTWVVGEADDQRKASAMTPDPADP